jgi:hypothetical protein
MGSVSEILLMCAQLLRNLALCIIGIFSLSGLEAARAQSPEVAVFSYFDSLAVTLDYERLITAERIEKLGHGYPLTFTVDVFLREDSKLWRDETIRACQLRFRVIHRDWDDKTDFEFSGPDGRLIQRPALTLDDLRQELEDRLLLTLGRVDDLDSLSRYYVEVTVGYRNLSSDDVQTAQEWLKTGKGGSDRDSVVETKPSLTESVVGLLWDIAGLGGETERYYTARFRLGDLRRGR